TMPSAKQRKALISREQGIPVSTRARGAGALDHIAFNAHDYDEVVSRLESQGVSAVRNDVPGGALRQLFLQDPNGSRSRSTCARRSVSARDVDQDLRALLAVQALEA